MERTILHCDCNAFYVSVGDAARPHAGRRAERGLRRSGKPARHHPCKMRKRKRSVYKRPAPSGRPGVSVQTYARSRRNRSEYVKYSRRCNELLPTVYRSG